MNIRMTGKNIDLTDGIKTRVEERLEKLQKYFNHDIDAHVTLRVQKLEQIAEITIPVHGTTLRAEASDKDLYSSIDLAVAKLEKQMQKYKAKLKNKHKNDNVFVEAFFETEAEEVEEAVISKIKHFDLKPMNDAEAIMQMDLVEHDFYVYLDEQDHAVRVAYRKKDGTYGIISAK